jgi:hypothetical protein
MKKVLLFVMTLAFLSVNAQKITVDQMETDGSHQIMTNMKNFVIEDRDYSMTLKVYETANKLDWRVTMSTFNNIPNDNIILLKLKNGQTVSLAVDSLHEETYTTNGVVYRSMYLSTVQPGVTKTYYVSESRIKAEELDSIDTYGISKIRLGNNVKYYETEWTNNPLGKHLTKCRKKIKERLQNAAEQKKDKGSIYDGF